MTEPNIKDYIRRELSEEEQGIAMGFVAFLEEKGMTFYKDNCECWRNKIYYWVQYNGECMCFISIMDPDEREHHWTVWSDDIAPELLADVETKDDIKELAWRRVDHCGHCGSCGGGRTKNVFGRVFEDVCGCTFRIDNPNNKDVLFMKYIIDLRLKNI